MQHTIEEYKKGDPIIPDGTNVVCVNAQGNYSITQGETYAIIGHKLDTMYVDGRTITALFYYVEQDGVDIGEAFFANRFKEVFVDVERFW